ncbi:MAG: DUF6268 family outer membrane beta-barrel protein [Bacteroidota bacterium]
MKPLAFLCFLLCLGLSVHAQQNETRQSIDILTISGQYGLPQPYDLNPPRGDATELSGLINLKVPIDLSKGEKRSIWYSQLTYNFAQINSDIDLPDGIPDPLRIQGFILQTGLVQKLDETQSLHLLFSPRFMTDFNNVSSSHFQLGGVVQYEKKFRKGFTMRFGAMYNQDFWGPMLVPLIYADWQLSNKWRFTGLVPIYSKIIYQVNPDLQLGLSHFGLITSYRLGDPAFAQDYIERKSVDVTLFARQKIANNLFLEGRAGVALNRAYEQYAVDDKMDFRIMFVTFGNDRVRKNVGFGDGAIFNLRLVYNLEITD